MTGGYAGEEGEGKREEGGEEGKGRREEKEKRRRERRKQKGGKREKREENEGMRERGGGYDAALLNSDPAEVYHESGCLGQRRL